MDEKSEALASESIRQLVWSGFYDAAEVTEIIDDSLLEPGEADPEWLRGRIEAEFRDKRAAEPEWPQVTDCDRPDRVFDRVNQAGLLALQNAGYTQSDGLSDVSHFYYEAGGERSTIEGYCFYHGQDLERVMKSGELYLSFEHIRGRDARGVEIGQRVKRALEDSGFRVKWDGSLASCLLVTGIRWQRRGGPHP